jgi:hypothetical protein
MWVHELDLNPIDFELGSKLIDDSFCYQIKNFVEFGAVIKHCKAIFSLFYINSSVKFVRRQQMRWVTLLFRHLHF